MTYAILSILYGPASESEEALITLRSFSENVRPHGVKMFWITDGMPRQMRNACRWYGCEVIDVKDDFSQNGWKQRHLWYARVAQDQLRGFDCILSIDAKDSCLRASPFHELAWNGFNSEFIYVSQEAATYRECEWNMEDMATAQRNVRNPIDMSNYPILNGGFVAAKPNLFAAFSLARYGFDAKSGMESSDQGSLNYLVRSAGISRLGEIYGGDYEKQISPRWYGGSPLFKEITPETPWIGHGHHYLKWPKPDPDYAIIHQWNRVNYPEEKRNLIIEKYGGV